MKQKLFSFRLAGLDVVVEAITGVVFLGLVVLFTVITLVLGLPLIEALIAGVLLAILHYVGSIWHHLGHSTTARRAGYPMIGITYWGLLGRSEYLQEGENDVPPQAHIQRAIGGAIFSAIACVVLFVGLLLLNGDSVLLHMVLAVALFENVAVYTLGALFPPVKMGDFSNDGATIAYWRKRL